MEKINDWSQDSKHTSSDFRSEGWISLISWKSVGPEVWKAIEKNKHDFNFYIFTK